MKTILLLGINARYSHSNLALLYLKRSIEDLDFNIHIAEFTISEGADKVFSTISSIKPDIIAVSVYIWNTLYIKSLLKSIKSIFSEIKIVLGGPEVTYNSNDWMEEFSGIDYIIAGPGETAFRQIAISEFCDEKKIISQPNPHFSRIKFPYSDSDLKSIGNRYIYYESSRGCPFSCTYCLSSVNSQGVEFRDIELVIEELDFFSFYDLTLIKFVDRVFNLKKDHYMIIWDEILKKFQGKKGKNTSFHFEIFPDLLDDNDIDFLSKVPSGLFQLEIGVQSTNAKTLSEINRKGTWTTAMENIRKISALKNIHLHTDIIAGLPYEGFSDFSKSFNNVFSLGAEHFQSGFLKILPGTAMMARTGDYGIKYNPAPPYEIIENRWIDLNDMAELKLIGELVDLIHNSGKFTETESFMIPLYKTPFDFYFRMAGIFKRHENARHRVWEYQAEILITMLNADFPDSGLELMDYLRWDWCSATKLNSYPEILRSENLLKAKKSGIQFFRKFSKRGIINYGDYTFTQNELKRSIFFTPESAGFMNHKMKDLSALFLPDKRVVFFNPHISA